ncbi:aromatic acid/H+ symport family MFS transporter [Sphingomonas oligophenolica]
MPQAPDRRSTLAMIGVCALVYFLDGLVHTILGPLAPDFGRALHLDAAAIGPIFSANLIGQCIGLVALPPLAARYGDRLVIALSLAGFGAAQAASGFAGDGTALFWWRLVTGIFLGGCLPSCLALVTAVAPPARRGLAITSLFTGYGLGAAMAGMVAAAFIDLGGWRAAMVAVGAVCLASAILAWLFLRDGSDPDAVDTAIEPAANPLELLSARYRLGTLLLWLLFITMLTISYCLSSWLPLLLVRLGHDQSFAAVALSIFSFGGIAAALVVGALIDRFGPTRVLVTFLLVAASLFLVTGWLIDEASARLLQLLLAGCGFFALGAYGGVNVVLAGFYPYRLRSTGIGWAKSVGRVGTVAAPVLIGIGLKAGVSEVTILSSFALPALLSAIALAALGVFNSAKAVGAARRQES